MNGADAVAEALRAAGVDVAFGLPGVHNMALWPAFERAGVRIVGMRHEQSCAYAADGYARATGNVGVALVTTGPGAANTVGAVGEAWASRVPVVVIATDIPTTLARPGEYRGVLHESTDQAAFFATITKARLAATTGDEIGGVVSVAIASAAAPPSRPVYVGIPTDLLDAPATPSGVPGPPAWEARSVKFEGVLALVQRSERPLIWVGSGARDAGDEIDALARRLGAPVVTTYQARGLLAPGHPLLVTAPPHEPEVTDLITRSDLAIFIGSDLDHMNTMGWRLPFPESRIAINLSRRDAEKNYAMSTVLESDAAPRGRDRDAGPGPQAVDRRRRDRHDRSRSPAPRPRDARRDRRSWSTPRLRFRPTRWSSPTCASPATGSPATCASAPAAGCTTRWAGARSATPLPAAIGAAIACERIPRR